MNCCKWGVGLLSSDNYQIESVCGDQERGQPPAPNFEGMGMAECKKHVRHDGLVAP